MLNLFPLPKKTSHEKRTWTENRKEVTSLWSYLIIFSIQIARKHQLEQLFTFANGKINNNPNLLFLRSHAKLKCDRISNQKYTRTENQFKRFEKKRHTNTHARHRMNATQNWTTTRFTKCKCLCWWWEFAIGKLFSKALNGIYWLLYGVCWAFATTTREANWLQNNRPKCNNIENIPNSKFDRHWQEKNHIPIGVFVAFNWRASLFAISYFFRK